MKNSLTVEQIKSIPELLKTKTRQEVAKEFGVWVTTIHYWVPRLRKIGFVIENRKRGRVSKLKINNETSTNIQGGETA